MNNKQPLIMSRQELFKTLLPFTEGKKVLIDMIQDIWNSSVPQPSKVNGQFVRMIFPKHWEDFTKLVAKENG